MTDQTETEPECRFCGDSRVLERHHIVPRRFDGSDGEDNLVVVCPTCHQLLERLYDRRFYEKINARVEDRDAYEQGVKDTLHLIFEETVEERGGVRTARESVVENLLEGHICCPGCTQPTKDAEECDKCGLKIAALKERA